MPASTTDRETPHNDGIYGLERLTSGVLAKDLTAGGTINLSAAEWEYRGFWLGGTPGATVTLTMGTVQGVKSFYNDTSQQVDLTKGATVINLAAATGVSVMLDGTTDGMKTV